ncbi:DUF547 domain-containing protein [Neolewinella litorea]|uniref:DUF547 domain-containing protein n=1 Tax=Neolewinella litorea TaxID=2562452 RepID=A0A4S4NQD1_9BACT|nr:DUF547 domain-containing protein [Neolewinella litorea]THH41345.1 DUF547 domain-containing protein [Neolewinella litorea]
MLRIFAFFISGFCLPACADGPPDTETSESLTVQAEVPDTVARDQIATTLAANTDAVPEKAPPPPPLAAAPSKPKAKPVPPPPPTNTAPATAPPKPKPVATSSLDPSHAQWNQLLQRYVSPAGRVDYAGLRQNRQSLDAYLDLLARDAPDAAWTREERLAYWINAYNAFTIQLILDNWPVKSIRDIDEPWDRKFITLEGKAYSLNQIEHEIIRPTFREPRIHFALVCAAISCPPLANQAYTPQNLDRMLEQQTRSFVNNEKFNVTQEAVVRVSPLFDWYAQDFGNPKAFLNRYLTTEIPAEKELHFLEYDWDLND